MNFNKKAITEVTSFILLTMLIVVSSTMAYLFSNDFLENKIGEIDRDNMENKLKVLNLALSEITSFDSQTRSISISFNSGTLKFNNNKIEYQSKVKYSGSSNCFNDVCYESVGGYENLYLNLSAGYVFDKNISFQPDSYLITFKNIKNESKIEIIMR